MRSKKILLIWTAALLALHPISHRTEGKEASVETLLQDLSVREIKAGAEMGDEHLQFLLGVIYNRGQGVEKDDWESAKWLRRAAEQGHSQAEYCFGTLCSAGKFIAKDYIEAYKWFELAAAQPGPSQKESIQARDVLAELMSPAQITEGKRRVAAFAPHKESGQRSGRTVRRTPELVALASQAESGDAEAQNRLGKACEKGSGTAQNFEEAIRWYRKAAGQGNASAQYNLGFMHYRGDGIEKDYSEAARWFRKASEQGCDVAQLMLGLMHFDGLEGVEQDDVEASKWLDLSISRGRPDLEKRSAKARKELRKRMTPQQAAETKKRVAAFVPKKELGR